MKHVRKINEIDSYGNKRNYLDVEFSECPVCGKKNSILEDNYDINFESFGVYYKCSVCNFEWSDVFSLTFTDSYDKDGDVVNIDVGIPKELYDEESVEIYHNSKKYNL